MKSETQKVETKIIQPIKVETAIPEPKKPEIEPKKPQFE
jgi:hypothetical protein